MGKTVLIALIRLYQKALSPLLMPACRFHPTCSDYAIEAIRVHGAVRGLQEAAWRVLRCNPYSWGGFYPV